MKHVLDNTNPYELNALFLQPTRWCGLSCKNCYVKEHAGGEEDYHISVAMWMDLFYHFYYGKPIASIDKYYIPWANQITVSIDNLPKDESKRQQMREIYNMLLRERLLEIEIYPEIHITVNSLEVLHEYGNTIPRYLNMLSISNISSNSLKELKEIKSQYPNLCVNYNHLIPSNVTSINISKYVNKMAEIGNIVDHIYLVINKSPIGRERNLLTHIGETSRMRSDISYINTMMERLPKNVRQKISIDGCLQDTIKSSRTGFGCSSNVSRLQIWPDGTVSGCPYSYTTTGDRAKSVEDIFENIRKARKQYDFREKPCHLPRLYDSISRRHKSKEP